MLVVSLYVDACCLVAHSVWRSVLVSALDPVSIPVLGIGIGFGIDIGLGIDICIED